MFELLKVEELTSTNSYALDLLNKKRITTPSLIVSDRQIAGRGQATNRWFSREGESLTLSFVLFPKKIKAEQQFVLSQAVCLAICETLSKSTKNLSVKWPNDILIDGVKCCGILIENAIMGSGLAYSICGVGLNVNNADFVGEYRATSLHLATGKTFDLDEVLGEIAASFEKYYDLAEKGELDFINKLYHKYLFKRDESLRFRDKNGEFTARVMGVDRYGQLLLEDEAACLRTYGFKEVQWLL